MTTTTEIKNVVTVNKTIFGVRKDYDMGEGKMPMPILEVKIINAEGEVVETGWLSPFRGYSFQVSWTPEGEFDHGSSKVIGLKHCLNLGKEGSGWGWQSNYNIENIKKALLEGIACTAIAEFTSRRNAIMPSIFCTRDEEWQTYIDDCAKFIRSL